jgi:hypothetical protein
MSSPLTRFAFIDSVHAAEILHVTQETVLDWIGEGKLTAYGGKPTNPFLRSGDVGNLAESLGVAADEPPKRTKSVTAKVQQRITADARWSDISIEEIREWATRADKARRQAARSAALTARQRLENLLAILEELGEQ